MLAKRFRALSFDDFFKLISSVFLVLLQLQRRIALVHEIITRLLKENERNGVQIGTDNMAQKEAMEPGKPILSVQPSSSDVFKGVNNGPPRYGQFVTDSADILFAASDLAHVRCGKLLTLRGEQNSQLNSKDFFKLFEITCWFVNTGEWICQRTCIGLRGTLMTQVWQNGP